MNDMNNINNNNINSKKINKIFLIIGIVVGVLIILGVVASFIINITLPSNNDYTLDDDVIENVTTTNPVSNEDKQLKECSVKPIQIEGKTEAEKALNKVKCMKSWDYFNNGNTSSDKLSDYDKVSTVLYNLGYFKEEYFPEEGCIITKETIDKQMGNLFLNVNYNPLMFDGNNCLPFSFDYDSQKNYYIVKNNLGGCGDGGFVVDKIYDERSDNNKLTFKTKVLWMGYTVSYLDTNNFKEIEGSENISYEEALSKYDSYANIYSWTFVKNESGEYVFDNIKKLK